MLTMGLLKKWITDTLRTDVAFNALCVSTIGSTLHYYRSSPIDRIVETLPFLTAYSNEANQDFNGNPEYLRTWDVPLALAITPTETSITDGTVTVWESVDKAEILAFNAIEVLRREARGCGIYGESVIILTTRLVVTEIGEADDVQANIFLTFGEMNHI